jgi:hypothetical protein
MLLLLQAVPDKGIQAEVRGNRQIHSDTHVTLSFLATAQNVYKSLPVVPHKAVAEVSKIGNL